MLNPDSPAIDDAARFAHECPNSHGLLIDENDYLIVDCRCFTSRDFLDAQDRMAVKLDLTRGG